MMRALVFGPNGQVGRELISLAPSIGAEAIPVGRDVVDLCDPAAISAYIETSGADIVINAAAYTAVDQAEDDRDAAFAVNAGAPEAMAQAAAKLEIPLLHISTDYVFEGLPGEPKSETDPVGPVSVYGESKLAGERAIEDSGCKYVILRTAWVFSAHGNNFVKTMLRVGRDRDELTVVSDQRGGPTAARDIASALWAIARSWSDHRGVSGIFHFAAEPATDWAAFADHIFDRAGWDKRPLVKPILSADWPTKARRPEHSVLDCSALHTAYGISQPDWRPALDDVIREL